MEACCMLDLDMVKNMGNALNISDIWFLKCLLCDTRVRRCKKKYACIKVRYRSEESSLVEN